MMKQGNKQHSGNKKLHSKLEEKYENALKDKKSSESNRIYRICDINTIIQFIADFTVLTTHIHF